MYSSCSVPSGVRRLQPEVMSSVLLVWTALAVPVFLSWGGRCVAGLSVHGQFLALVLTDTAALLAVAIIAVAICNQKLGLILLIVGYPIINRPAEYFNIVIGPLEITPFNLCLAAIVLLSLRQLGRVVLTRTDAWLAAFAVLAVVPTLMAHDVVLSTRGYVFAIVEPIAIYFLVRGHFERSRWDELLMVIAAFLVVHWAFIAVEAFREGGLSALIRGRLEGGAYYGAEGAPRVFTGGLGEPLQASWVVLPLWPIFTFAAPYSRRLYLLVAAGILAEVFLGLSRLPIGSVGLLMFPCAVVATILFKLGRVKKIVVMIAIVTVIAGSAIGPLVMSRFSGAKNAGVASDPMILHGRDMDINSLFYLSVIKASFDIALDHPMGIGLNNANEDASYYRWSEMLSDTNISNINTGMLVPHIGAFAHFGVGGALAFFAFLWCAMCDAIHAARRGAGLDRAAAAGVLVTIVVFGLLLGKFFPVPVGGFLTDRSIDPVAAPVNQQVVWSFIVLAFGRIVTAGQTSPS